MRRDLARKVIGHMTKLSKDFNYEKLLEQVEVTNVSSCYGDHANPVLCKRLRANDEGC